MNNLIRIKLEKIADHKQNDFFATDNVSPHFKSNKNTTYSGKKTTNNIGKG